MTVKTGREVREPRGRTQSIREELEGRLSSIPGLTRRAARRGHGNAYFAAEREIVHFQGDQRMDVRLTRKAILARASERPFDERVRTRGPAADWVAVRVAVARDLHLALSLVELAVRANTKPAE